MEYNGEKFKLLKLGENESLKNDTLLFTDNMSDVLSSVQTVKE